VERQIQSPAKHDEPGAHLTNGFAIALAEDSNRLVVRNKPVSHITSTLRPFKNLKRWHADIAVRPSASA
jgi:hypothetical protein